MLEKKIEIDKEIDTSSLLEAEQYPLNNYHIEKDIISSSLEAEKFSLTNNQVVKINENKKSFSSSEETKVEVNVFDVSSYILKKTGKISSMKLQKLVYYCQVWSLVWDEQPLFPEKIKAWANGPVIGELFFQLKGLFQVDEDDLLLGNYRKLNDTQIETINAVIDYYGDKSAQWLIELTHDEYPWRKARIGIAEGDRSTRIIDLDSIAEYYSSLSDG